MKIIIIFFIIIGAPITCVKISKMTPRFIKDSYSNVKSHLEEGKIAQKMDSIEYEKTFEKIKQMIPGIEQVLVDDQLRKNLQMMLELISKKKDLDHERALNSSCYRAMLLMLLFNFNVDQKTMKDKIKESDKSYSKKVHNFCMSSEEEKQKKFKRMRRNLYKKMIKLKNIYIIETVSGCKSEYEHYIICIKNKKSGNFMIYQAFKSLYSLETSIINPKEFSDLELSNHLSNLNSPDEFAKRESLKELFYYPNPYHTEDEIMDALLQEFPSPVYYDLNDIPFVTERNFPIKYREVDEKAEINVEIFDLKSF